MQDNLEAVISVLQFIYDNIMYAELNTKSDYCQVCGCLLYTSPNISRHELTTTMHHLSPCSEEITYFYVCQGMSRLGKVLRVASN